MRTCGDVQVQGDALVETPFVHRGAGVGAVAAVRPI